MKCPSVRGPAGDGAGHAAHAGCVGQGQVLAGTDGHAGRHLDLAAQVVQERAVRDVTDPVFGPLEGGGNGGDVLFAGGLEREVNRGPRRAHLHQVHAHDDGTDRADDLPEPRQQGRVRVRGYPDGDRVAGARRPGGDAQCCPWRVSLHWILTARRGPMLRPGQTSTVPKRSGADGLGDEG